MEKWRVIVESVYPLTEKQQTQLANEVKKIFLPHKIPCYFKLNSDLIGGIKIHFGNLILDDSVLGKWQIARKKVVLTEVGHVDSVQDSVAHIVGLPSAQFGEKICFESGAVGMTLNLNEDSLDVCLIQDGEKVKEGEAVYRTNEVLKIPTGLSLMGRIINPL